MAAHNSQGGAKVRVPPPLVFLLLSGIGMLLEGAGYGFSVPFGKTPLRVCVWLLLLGGSALLISALFLFQRSGQDPEPWKPSPHLIGGGPYRFSRNPIYLSMVLFQSALGLVFDNLWIVILALPALLVVHYAAVLPEERYLAEKFGDAYNRYTASVPRYLGWRTVRNAPRAEV